MTALDHVSSDVAREVQEALLAFRDHYTYLDLKQKMRCETTTQLAELAKIASDTTGFTGFRSARS